MGGNTQTWQAFLDCSQVSTPAAFAKTGRDHGVVHHELTERLALVL